MSACAAGKVAGQVVLDVDDTEDKEGQADLPIAIMPSTNQVTLLQLDGQLNDEEFKKAFEWAQEGARKVYHLQREALIRPILWKKRETHGD